MTNIFSSSICIIRHSLCHNRANLTLTWPKKGYALFSKKKSQVKDQVKQSQSQMTRIFLFEI